MESCISRGEFQRHLDLFFEKHRRMATFPEMLGLLQAQGLLRPAEAAAPPSFPSDGLSDRDFEDLLDRLPLPFDQVDAGASGRVVVESDLIPEFRDVFVFRHFRNTVGPLHTHDFFEIDFVSRGSCTFLFGDETFALQEGDVCLVAPGSLHDLRIEDADTCAITVMIRRSTFNSTFFSLLSHRDVLSGFFRTILYEKSRSNYLLFQTGAGSSLKRIVKDLALESQRDDAYSNTCCISWANLLFTELLRTYGGRTRYHDEAASADAYRILQHVQRNYRDLTLASLAERFHYSESRLSILIRRNTGRNFSDLVRQMKMQDAEESLQHTDLRIAEIAEATGYHSADHFSRVFRACHGQSPLEYRKAHRV